MSNEAVIGIVSLLEVFIIALVGWVLVANRQNKQAITDGLQRTNDSLSDLGLQVIAIKTSLVGYEGRGGLAEEVSTLRDAYHRLSGEVQIVKLAIGIKEVQSELGNSSKV